MRNEGYLVDLDENTVFRARNFKMNYDRHKGRYDSIQPNYNQALYDGKFYFGDQNLNLVRGDYYYFNKVNTRRVDVRRYLSILLLGLICVYLDVRNKRKFHLESREKAKQSQSVQNDTKMNKILDFKLKDNSGKEFMLSELPKVPYLLIVNLENPSHLLQVQESFFKFKRFGDILVLGHEHLSLAEESDLAPDEDEVFILDSERRVVFEAEIEEEIDPIIPKLNAKLANLYTKCLISSQTKY